MEYKLVLLDTAEGINSIEWPLHLPAVVGRSREADICIAHPSISRRHCQFFQHADGSLAVKDMASMNGTYVGDQRIKEVVLMPGDTVQIGGVTLRVDWTYDTVDEFVDSSSKADVAKTQPVTIIPPRRIEGFSTDNQSGDLSADLL